MPGSDDSPGSVVTVKLGSPARGGFRNRADGGFLRRFQTVAPHGNRASAGLPDGHPALVEGRTLFPSTVVDATAAPRLLIGGENQAKIGRRILKGPWAGLRIYCLTLEERATCPRSCHLWSECYGNAMHLARRHRHGRALEQRLDTELWMRHAMHPDGIAVRLHVLGDFYSLEYVRRWAAWMHDLPLLHVFGFTAHPRDSEIGARVAALNERHPDRWAIRFSVARHTGAGMEAMTFWDDAPASDWHEGALMCPQQRGKTDACATCGLCWSESARQHAIGFNGHGKRGGARDR